MKNPTGPSFSFSLSQSPFSFSFFFSFWGLTSGSIVPDLEEVGRAYCDDVHGGEGVLVKEIEVVVLVSQPKLLQNEKRKRKR